MDAIDKRHINDIHRISSYLDMIDKIDDIMSQSMPGYIFFSRNDSCAEKIALSKEDNILGKDIKEAILKILREKYRILNEELKLMQKDF